MLKKIIWANFQRIIELFTQKALKNMALGSGIRDPEETYSGSRIPYPEIKKAPDPGSGSATLIIGSFEVTGIFFDIIWGMLLLGYY